MMKSRTMMVIAGALAALAAGCLVSGQITIFQKIDAHTVTNSVVTPILVNLNEEEDYVEHKEDIKSVDEISVVALMKNNLDAPAEVKMYLSDDLTLTSVAQIENPENATLVFVGPTVPASSTLRIGWTDGYRYVVDKNTVVDQVLGDGIFALYATADGEFNLQIKAEVAVTLTVGK